MNSQEFPRNRRAKFSLRIKTGSANSSWKGGRSKNHYFYKKRQMKRYPDRIKARDAVRHAVTAGKLVRGVCHCGNPDTEGHHHRGYSHEHRLDVVWLCRPHHREADAALRHQANPVCDQPAPAPYSGCQSVGQSQTAEGNQP